MPGGPPPSPSRAILRLGFPPLSPRGREKALVGVNISAVHVLVVAVVLDVEPPMIRNAAARLAKAMHEDVLAHWPRRIGSRTKAQLPKDLLLTWVVLIHRSPPVVCLRYGSGWIDACGCRVTGACGCRSTPAFVFGHALRFYPTWLELNRLANYSGIRVEADICICRLCMQPAVIIGPLRLLRPHRLRFVFLPGSRWLHLEELPGGPVTGIRKRRLPGTRWRRCAAGTSARPRSASILAIALVCADLVGAGSCPHT